MSEALHRSGQQPKLAPHGEFLTCHCKYLAWCLTQRMRGSGKDRELATRSVSIIIENIARDGMRICRWVSSSSTGCKPSWFMEYSVQLCHVRHWGFPVQWVNWLVQMVRRVQADGRTETRGRRCALSYAMSVSCAASEWVFRLGAHSRLHFTFNRYYTPLLDRNQ